MSDLVHPFTGYLPQVAIAHRMVSPPIAMLSPDKRQTAREDPLSFRHVVGRGSGTTIEEASKWFDDCIADGVLEPVGPVAMIYRLVIDDHVATGVLGEVSVAAYDAGAIKKHELTRSDTESGMAQYMSEAPVNGNPVALAHAPNADVAVAIAKYTSGDPHLTFTAADGVTHTLWLVDGNEGGALCDLFGDSLYITDGHHRMAAASLLARQGGDANARVPVGLFGADELWVRAFTRCVIDPTLDPTDVVRRLDAEFELEPIAGPKARPIRSHEFGCRIGGKAYMLRLPADVVPSDLYGSLDVVLLQELVLGPIFGITDPRDDPRLHYVADTRSNRGEVDCDADFLPYPASVHDVMAVADAGLTMPPKSTWFAPKLPSGLVLRPAG